MKKDLEQIISSLKDLSPSELLHVQKEIAESLNRQNVSGFFYETPEFADSLNYMLTSFLPDSTVIMANEAYARSLGLPKDKLIGKKFFDFIPKEDAGILAEQYKTLSPQNPFVVSEHKVISVDDNIRWTRWTDYGFFDRDGKLTHLHSLGDDITEAKELKQKLSLSEKRYRAVFDNARCGIVITDSEGKILEVNPEACLMLGYSKKDFLGKNIVQAGFVSYYKLSQKAEEIRVQEGGFFETQVTSKDGSLVEVEVMTSPIVQDNKVIYMSIVLDVTERKEHEREIKKMCISDFLTGLYNRAFFEAEMSRLNNSRDYPVTIVCADLDGLKVINDSYGHHIGDELLKEAAALLKGAVRKSEIVARIGGDEFSILLPQTDEHAGKEIVDRIRSHIKEYNIDNLDFPLSISLGYSTAKGSEKSLEQVFREADDSMYAEKLREKSSSRSQIVSGLMKALEERDYITQGHSERLEKMCYDLGEELDLPESQLYSLRLLSKFHDLGKIGIPDYILLSKDSLDKDEWKIMKKHPEKGYRIAQSIPSLIGVSDLILRHHERWDGKGYPLGIQGEEIPIECRILAVVDAYDAMTNDRPYRKAMSKAEAFEEIRRNAGTQFDPNIASMFLEKYEQK
jgi:diguanylate cyclase (GGDEF)-like protein/PAS domain S-box-containing protein